MSGKIDPKTTEILGVFDEIVSRAKIPYVVVGATARDIVLHYGFGAKMERATNDIDFGIRVPSWEAFANIKSAMVANGFQETKESQRLIRADGAIVDIVPFGAIELSNAVIKWPPKGEVIMTVLGFQEVCDSAQRICINEAPRVEVPVAMPNGMTILKLIVWTERAANKRKQDAQDFIYLLKGYQRIPQVVDELYENDNLMDEYEWDLTLSGARLLGKHASEIAGAPVRKFISELLSSGIRGLTVERLIEESLSASRVDNEYEENFGLAQAYFKGFKGA